MPASLRNFCLRLHLLSRQMFWNRVMVEVCVEKFCSVSSGYNVSKLVVTWVSLSIIYTLHNQFIKTFIPLGDSRAHTSLLIFVWWSEEMKSSPLCVQVTVVCLALVALDQIGDIGSGIGLHFLIRWKECSTLNPKQWDAETAWMRTAQLVDQSRIWSKLFCVQDLESGWCIGGHWLRATWW